jgi:hypothetical protein
MFSNPAGPLLNFANGDNEQKTRKDHKESLRDPGFNVIPDQP